MIRRESQKKNFDAGDDGVIITIIITITTTIITIPIFSGAGSGHGGPGDHPADQVGAVRPARHLSDGRHPGRDYLICLDFVKTLDQGPIVKLTVEHAR